MSPLIRLIIVCLLCAPALASATTLKLIGHQSLPSDTTFQQQTVGGLSGITYVGENCYLAISDNRGSQRYGHPTFYRIHLDYDQTGLHQVSIKQATFIKQRNGKPYPKKPTVDPEAIRLAPNGNLYWSSEGNYHQTLSKRTQPHVQEMTQQGEFVRAFHHPNIYNYTNKAKTGGRNNMLFEALAVDENGMVYVGNEDALKQDGNTATEYSNSALRITALDPKTEQASKQYAYILPNIPNDSGLLFYQTNGLTDLLSIGNNGFIALERAFVAGVGNTIRLVRTYITPETTDVSKMDSLIGTHYTPMTRKLLLELPPTYQGIKIDNIEGITWGKTLANGNRTLVLVSDNNFSQRQVTQFLVFEVTED